VNRRGFLSLLGTTLGAATLDPERLLWTPGEKTISIPKNIALARNAAALRAQLEFMRPRMLEIFEQERADHEKFSRLFVQRDRQIRNFVRPMRIPF
jgi:hypothetical protein